MTALRMRKSPRRGGLPGTTTMRAAGDRLPGSISLAPVFGNVSPPKSYYPSFSTPDKLLLSPCAHGAGRRNPEITGAHRAVDRRFFMPICFPWRAVRGTVRPWPVTQWPVSYPRAVRHPIAVGSDGDGSNLNTGAVPMNTPIQGTPPEFRPNFTPTPALVGELIRVAVAVDAASCLLDLAIRRPDQAENISAARLDVILDALIDASNWLTAAIEAQNKGGRS